MSKMELKYQIGKLKQKAIMAIVWKLPYSIVYWSYIRVASMATTGKWSNTVATDLSMMDALKRFEEGRDK